MPGLSWCWLSKFEPSPNGIFSSTIVFVWFRDNIIWNFELSLADQIFLLFPNKSETWIELHGWNWSTLHVSFEVGLSSYISAITVFEFWSVILSINTILLVIITTGNIESNIFWIWVVSNISPI